MSNMRLFLLPLTPTRTLLYAHRLPPLPSISSSTLPSTTDTSNTTTTPSPSLLDQATTRAAVLWTSWESSPTGWKNFITHHGNRALQRISYEEWGLKSVPPLPSTPNHNHQPHPVSVLFPSRILDRGRIPAILRQLATSRQSIHRQRMYICLLTAPLTAPIALLPIVPNIPFFYLLFRGWSHWRAWSGGRHLEQLLDRNLLTLEPSHLLDAAYAPTATQASPHKTDIQYETILLNQQTPAEIADAMQVPELGLELERAIAQVRATLSTNKDEQIATEDCTQSDSAEWTKDSPSLAMAGTKEKYNIKPDIPDQPSDPASRPVEAKVLSAMEEHAIDDVSVSAPRGSKGTERTESVRDARPETK